MVRVGKEGDDSQQQGLEVVAATNLEHVASASASEDSPVDVDCTDYSEDNCCLPPAHNKHLPRWLTNGPGSVPEDDRESWEVDKDRWMAPKLRVCRERGCQYASRNGKVVIFVMGMLLDSVSPSTRILVGCTCRWAGIIELTPHFYPIERLVPGTTATTAPWWVVTRPAVRITTKIAAANAPTRTSGTV